MPVLTEERQEKIKLIVAEILEVEPENLTETANFAEDYEADSLRAIEVLASLEREFKIEIPQDELPRMVNLAEVRKVVEQYC